MDGTPRISIAVPSLNQGRFLRTALQSLVDQDYPELEVIVQDGGSTDDSIATAREFVDAYPETIRLDVFNDSGPAQAINRALATATGEIFGFLHADDRLLPGCLRRVASEVDPARGRHVVFGRSAFVSEEGVPYGGAEAPADYRGRYHLLAVWRSGDPSISHASVFWHRRVSERCGGFDERFTDAVDYLQWCGFSRHFRFHRVDAVWTAVRVHDGSLSARLADWERLALLTGFSRMHWGPWWHPLRWRCELSYWWYRRDGHERARHHARRAESARAARRHVPALSEALRAAALSPGMAARRFAAPALRRLALAFAERALCDRATPGFSGRYGDGWIGPLYRADLHVPEMATRLRLVLALDAIPEWSRRTVSVTVLLEGRRVQARRARGSRRIELLVPLERWRGASCRLEVRTNPAFVPPEVDGAADARRLSAILVEQIVE
jgi:glycosyltransferase involved in cell wall biosynthesis